LEIARSATDLNCNHSLPRPQLGSKHDVSVRFVVFFWPLEE